MNYAHRPITEFLRGPLLRTPQGWVVLASLAFYWLLALLMLLTGFNPLPTKEGGGSVVLALLYPLVVFVYFVRFAMPEFRFSASDSAILLLAALMPVGLVGWQWLQH